MGCRCACGACTFLILLIFFGWIEQHRSSTSTGQATISWVTMLQRPLPVSSMLCQSWRACSWQETFWVAWSVDAVHWWSMDLIFGAALGNWRDTPCNHPKLIQIIACTCWILFGKSEKLFVCVCVCVCNPSHGCWKKGHIVNRAASKTPK